MTSMYAAVRVRNKYHVVQKLGDEVFVAVADATTEVWAKRIASALNDATRQLNSNESNVGATWVKSVVVGP